MEKLQTYKDLMQNWYEWDIAMYFLAVSLGILPYDDNFGGKKGMFYTKNPMSETLSKLLFQLEEIGVLDTDEHGRYRWKEGCEETF